MVFRRLGHRVAFYRSFSILSNAPYTLIASFMFLNVVYVFQSHLLYPMHKFRVC